MIDQFENAKNLHLHKMLIGKERSAGKVVKFNIIIINSNNSADLFYCIKFSYKVFYIPFR